MHHGTYTALSNKSFLTLLNRARLSPPPPYLHATTQLLPQVILAKVCDIHQRSLPPSSTLTHTVIQTEWHFHDHSDAPNIAIRLLDSTYYSREFENFWRRFPLMNFWCKDPYIKWIVALLHNAHLSLFKFIVCDCDSLSKMSNLCFIHLWALTFDVTYACERHVNSDKLTLRHKNQ